MKDNTPKNDTLRKFDKDAREGFGMLKQNFKILRDTVSNGTENSDRLQKSVDTLKKYLDKPESDKLTTPQRERIEGLIEEFKVS